MRQRTLRYSNYRLGGLARGRSPLAPRRPLFLVDAGPLNWLRPRIPPYIIPFVHTQLSEKILRISFIMADSFRPRLQSLTGSILSHRVFLYSFASTLAVSATVINALQNHSNFYSVAVYLSKSGASVLVAFFSGVHVVSTSTDCPLFRRSSPISAYSWL